MFNCGCKVASRRIIALRANSFAIILRGIALGGADQLELNKRWADGREPGGKG